MHFEFTQAPVRRSLRSDEPTFRVGRLWRLDAGHTADVSHLIDRTYAYRSVRELRWHLAERFASPVDAVVIRAP